VTCCVAALCDAGNTLILVSDRMFATWGIQLELEINKCRVLSSHWCVWTICSALLRAVGSR
jgi:hypothetical protein